MWYQNWMHMVLFGSNQSLISLALSPYFLWEASIKTYLPGKTMAMTLVCIHMAVGGSHKTRWFQSFWFLLLLFCCYFPKWILTVPEEHIKTNTETNIIDIDWGKCLTSTLKRTIRDKSKVQLWKEEQSYWSQCNNDNSLFTNVKRHVLDHLYKENRCGRRKKK